MLHEFAEKSIKKQVGNWVDPPPRLGKIPYFFLFFFLKPSLTRRGVTNMEGRD